MSQVLDAMMSATNRTIISDSHVSLTGEQLLFRVEQASAVLAKGNPGPVAFLIDNGIDWVTTDLACLMAGRVAVPLPHFFSDSQIRYVLSEAGVDTIVTDGSGNFLEKLHHFRAGGNLPGTETTVLHDEYRKGNDQKLPPATSKITFTSGSTGRPKGVCLTQATMEAVASSVAEATAPLYIERHLCLLPLATLLENVAGVYAPVLAGGNCVIPSLIATGLAGNSTIRVDAVLEQLDVYRPESIILVPELLLTIVLAVEAGKCVPDSLRFAAVGGARVSKDLLKRAAECGIPAFEGYGLSECSSVVTLNLPGSNRPGSAGRPLHHARIDITDEGEIVVYGPRMSGYLGEHPTDNKQWATGDLGRLDEDGYLIIEGRRRNVFISSLGRNVSPEWVESELTQSGVIGQAAVLGESRPWCTAVVVPARPGIGESQLQAAIDQANSQLPDYAQIGGWLLADEPFTSANGLCGESGSLQRLAVARRYRVLLDELYRRDSGSGGNHSAKPIGFVQQEKRPE